VVLAVVWGLALALSVLLALAWRNHQESGQPSLQPLMLQKTIFSLSTSPPLVVCTYSKSIPHLLFFYSTPPFLFLLLIFAPF
jgi:hypothetical protein